ncbi:hypothetical protein CRENPOLYSF1_220049 [Crenothrix polyspora]|uniref:Uncharacterized protein n=1 Tax=Crenothrix polyspora TaxID=360316 RepID=A0A1R4H6M5_9GAMM|nr:hypothetical protein CRENPOLYSF1_220049 [Crenothrix polyspora]
MIDYLGLQFEVESTFSKLILIAMTVIIPKLTRAVIFNQTKSTKFTDHPHLSSQLK